MARRPSASCPAALRARLCGTALGATPEGERRDSPLSVNCGDKESSPRGPHAPTSPQVSLARFVSWAHPKATTGENHHDWLGRHANAGGGGLTKALSERGARCWGGLLGVAWWVDRAGNRGGRPVRSQTVLGQLLEAGPTDVLID